MKTDMQQVRQKIKTLTKLNVRGTIESLEVGQYAEFSWAKVLPNSVRANKRLVEKSTGRQFVLNQSSFSGKTRITRIK